MQVEPKLSEDDSEREFYEAYHREVEEPSSDEREFHAFNRRMQKNDIFGESQDSAAT